MVFIQSHGGRQRIGGTKREEPTTICNFATLFPWKKSTHSSYVFFQNQLYSLQGPEEGINGLLLTDFLNPATNVLRSHLHASL